MLFQLLCWKKNCCNQRGNSSDVDESIVLCLQCSHKSIKTTLHVAISFIPNHIESLRLSIFGRCSGWSNCGDCSEELWLCWGARDSFQDLRWESTTDREATWSTQFWLPFLQLESLKMQLNKCQRLSKQENHQKVHGHVHCLFPKREQIGL